MINVLLKTEERKKALVLFSQVRIKKDIVVRTLIIMR